MGLKMHKLEVARDVIAALFPSLIGSAVAQVWKPGINWKHRFLQWIVGSTVSYYATAGIIALTGWNEFAAQSIAFGIALVAFDATPVVIRAVKDTLATIPARIADRFLGHKG
jgi:hypothetical protein